MTREASVFGGGHAIWLRHFAEYTPEFSRDEKMWLVGHNAPGDVRI